MTEAKIVQTEATFDLCVENISKLNNFNSSQIMVRGIPWTISIKKSVPGNEEWLGVYVHCKEGDISRDWTATASFIIQLISSRDELNTFQKGFEHYVFISMANSYGYLKFIKWKDLFDIEKGFVENDTIRFNIKIKVADPNDKRASKLQVDFNKCCDECSHKTLQVTVTNIDKLTAIRTPELKLQNQSWDLTVFKHSVNGLGLRLQPFTSSTVTYKAKVDVKIKSTVVGVQDIEKTQSTQNRSPKCLHMYPIISWDELFKPANGYIVNNSVTFEVKIKVEKVEEATSTAKKRRASSAAFEMECPICFEKMKGQEISSTDCGHLFCSECIKKVVRARKPCPTCNTKLNLSKVHRVYLPFAKKD